MPARHRPWFLYRIWKGKEYLGESMYHNLKEARKRYPISRGYRVVRTKVRLVRAKE